jgi:hypothetical protein
MIRRSLCVAALLPLLAMPAQAQVPPAAEVEVEVGTSLICDTQEQVQRFVALYDGDVESAINGVNAAEHDPTACGVSTMAYVRGPQLATARNKDAAFEIVQILVLGVVTDAGVKSVTPAPFFSLFAIDEIRT